LIKIVHYINQFYGGIGGEEFASYKPEVREGFVGPGLGLNAQIKGQAEIVATVICGDTYFNENMEEAKAEIITMIKKYNPDIFVAGPAFNAGRYGVACGAICQAVKNELNIPVVTAMYPENPGVVMYVKDAYILQTTNSAAGMRKALPALGVFLKKLIAGETIGTPEEEGYIPRGIRVNYFNERRGSARAVDLLVKKLHDEEFVTEFPMPIFDNVEPHAPVENITQAKIAIVTSGGIVPKGNPDHIESSSASKYGKYDISDFDDLTSETHETAHGGYDPTYANQDSDRVIPVDVLRNMVKEGKIGSLYNYFFSTTGNGTAVANAKKWGAEIAKQLVADGVNAVILTST
jgi:glycine reductase